MHGQIICPLVEDVAVFLDQVLCRRRPGTLCLCLMVCEQGTTGRATHTHGQIFLVKAQILSETSAGLQGQGAQTQCESTSHALFRVCQRVHDAGIGQGFAAPCGCHVDDEGTMQIGLIAQAQGHVGGLVLPLKTSGTAALAQGGRTQVTQTLPKIRQGVADASRITGNAQQMLVQWLLEMPLLVCIGMACAACISSDASGILAFQTGVVVISQHQAKACQMHHIGVVEPALLLAGALAQGLQALCQPGSACTPFGEVYW